jgi:hypothetical protein
MRDDLYAFCARCAGERPVLMPPCADGHGADCPERCCAECGSAFFFDAFLLDPLAADRSAAGLAPAPRAA